MKFEAILVHLTFFSLAQASSPLKKTEEIMTTWFDPPLSKDESMLFEKKKNSQNEFIYVLSAKKEFRGLNCSTPRYIVIPPEDFGRYTRVMFLEEKGEKRNGSEGTCIHSGFTYRNAYFNSRMELISAEAVEKPKILHQNRRSVLFGNEAFKLATALLEKKGIKGVKFYLLGSDADQPGDSEGNVFEVVFIEPFEYNKVKYPPQTKVSFDEGKPIEFWLAPSASVFIEGVHCKKNVKLGDELNRDDTDGDKNFYGPRNRLRGCTLAKDFTSPEGIFVPENTSIYFVAKTTGAKLRLHSTGKYSRASTVWGKPVKKGECIATSGSQVKADLPIKPEDLRILNCTEASEEL